MSINSSGEADFTRLDIGGTTVVDTNRNIIGNNFNTNGCIVSNLDYEWDTSHWILNTVGSKRWQDIAYGNDVFVAVGSMYDGSWTGYIAYSNDAISWTIDSQPRPWYCAAYGNGIFVIGASKRIAYSNDGGVNWTGISLGSGLWKCITYGNGIFVAGGGFLSGEIAYSTNGSSWTTSTVGSGEWEDITFGNGRFVIAGDGGRIAYSDDDGSSWTVSTVGSLIWTAVVFGNNRFVVAGISGRMAYSDDDGSSWTVSTVGSSTWISLTYGNGRFIVGGISGRMAYSDDGINWTVSTVGSSTWRSILYADNKFIAVSDNSKIAYSQSIVKVDNCYLSTVDNSTTNTIDLPIGTNLIVYSVDSFQRNQSSLLYMSSSNQIYETSSSTGSIKMKGIWRSRGKDNTLDYYLFQRTE